MKKFFSVFTLLSLGACTLFGIDFYISPEGSDANSGAQRSLLLRFKRRKWLFGPSVLPILKSL